MRFRITYRPSTGQTLTTTLEAPDAHKAAMRLREWKGQSVKIVGLARA